MERIVYTSHASTDLASDDVFRIVTTSARNNPSRDVTGFLIYHERRFLQLVEGEGEALEVLRRDPRHRDLTIHSREPARERCFPNWRMRRLGSSSEAMEDILRTLSQHAIGPRCMELVSDFLTYAEPDARRRTV